MKHTGRGPRASGFDQSDGVLADFLLAVADDELVIGHRHSEWTGFAPDIESDVALSSIAQEEIGHAKLFYERAAEVLGGTADTLAYGRSPGEFRNAILTERPNGDWGYTIVRLFLYDQADAVRLDALAEGRSGPVAELAGALRREEKYHLMYGEQWLRRLAGAGEDAQRRVQQALEAAWPEAVGLFEAVPDEEALVDSGIMAMDAAAQAGRWRERIVSILEEVGLRIGKDTNGAGGRSGRHSADLSTLLADMTEVYRTEPGARW